MGVNSARSRSARLVGRAVGTGYLAVPVLADQVERDGAIAVGLTRAADDGARGARVICAEQALTAKLVRGAVLAQALAHELDARSVLACQRLDAADVARARSTQLAGTSCRRSVCHRGPVGTRRLHTRAATYSDRARCTLRPACDSPPTDRSRHHSGRGSRTRWSTALPALAARCTRRTQRALSRYRMRPGHRSRSRDRCCRPAGRT